MALSNETGAGPRIDITEVGLRDGLQSEPRHVPLEEKIELARALVAAGLRSFELTSFVSPRAVPQLADAAALFAALRDLPQVELSALVANERGVSRAIDAGAKALVFFASASESHNLKNINSTRQASLERFEKMAALAQGSGMEIHAAVATAFGCPFEGEVPVAEVVRMAKAYAALGASRIKLGDTIGTATPDQVTRLVQALRAELPETELCLHFHNTRGVGLVCVWQGIAEGVRRFESSIGGLGGCPFVPEATGNIATEDLVYLLHESGYQTGIDIAALPPIVQSAQAAVGHDLPGLYGKAGPRLRTWPMDAARTARG